MRIYDLEKRFEELIKDGMFRIEIVGEDGIFTVKVSTREWNNELQEFVYSEKGSCTSPSFLYIYDFVADIVFNRNICFHGYDINK